MGAPFSWLRGVAAVAATVQLLVQVGTTHADYLLLAVSSDSGALVLERGATFELELWATSDNEDVSNAAIFQIVFSEPGLKYDSFVWHGIYEGSIYDDSTPNAGQLPVDFLTDTVFAGPAGLVDIELSNVAVDPYCVNEDAENAGGGPCDCPGGSCIGGSCIGGSAAGAGCTVNCTDEDMSCLRDFSSGKLATLTLIVPVDFGPNLVLIQPVADTMANGFEDVDTDAGAAFRLYLVCKALGDFDCDGCVTLGDYGQWGACLTGPGGAVSPLCSTFDLDSDGDVDLIDWGMLQSFFTVTCDSP